MKAFLIRTSVLIVLWGLFFFSEGTVPSVRSLLICAAVMAVYFFQNSTKRQFMLFLLNLLLLLALYFFTINPYVLALLFYFSVMAIFDLEENKFKWLSVLICISLLSFLIIGKLSGVWLILSLLFYYIANRTNGLASGLKEQRKIYEELLGEYRRLKRVAALSEEEARFQERTKITREIHDSVGHKLTALLMQLEILSIEKGEEEYKELKDLAKDCLAETRFAVRTLTTGELEGMATILQLIKKLELESHILVQLTTKRGILSVKLTNEQSVVLYRVIQEGLTNAMRHAQSREVYVELGRNAVGDIEFSIKNKVHENKTFQEGFGLQNMRRRVEELDGKLSIQQREGHFIVKGMIPVTEQG